MTTSSESLEERAEDSERTQRMGVLGATSYVVGCIVGSGIFITPTSILGQTKSIGLSLTVWVLSAVISTLGAFCYVELGTSIRVSGGDFSYLCFMKWYPVAFSFMCIMVVLNIPPAIAVQATTFSEYVFRGCLIELDQESDYWAKKFTEISLLSLLMVLNFFSLKKFASPFQVAATLAKVIAAATVIGCGLYFLIVEGKTENLADPFNGSVFTVGSFTKALFAGLYSYDGWDVLNVGAEEIKSPRRTMPLAITIGMATVTVIYVAMNVSFFVILSVPELMSTPAVAMIFAEKTLGKAAFIMPISVAIVLIGSINGAMFKGSRAIQAVAKLGYLPTSLSSRNRIEESPRVALVVNLILSLIMLFVGDLNTLINYSSFAKWSQCAITMGALMWIKLRHIPVHSEGMKTPIVLPFLFCCVCSGMIIANIVEDFKESAVGLSILLGSFIIFMVFVYNKTLYSLNWYRKSIAAINDQTTKLAQILFNVMPERGSMKDRDQVIGRIPTDDESEKISKSATLSR